MLVVNDVSIHYAERPILDGINFSLEKGQIGCLLGPSGCGKTSLLRAICGFKPIQSGSIQLNKQTVSSRTTHLPVQQRNLGMVFQDYALFPHLTVSENIAFGLHMLHRHEQALRVKECLDLVNLSDFSSRMPHALSGGQKQRVALARALAPKPKMLLLDEPFSSLDVSLRESLAQDVHAILKAEQITALMVTHDQKEAFSVADVIGVLERGKLHQWGDAKTLYNQPSTSFVGTFVGEGTLVSGELNGVSGTLLIRPEHTDISPTGPFSGKVLAKQFRGGSYTYHIALDAMMGTNSNNKFIIDKTQNLLVQASLTHLYEIGDRVKLAIDFTQAVNFNEANAEEPWENK
jgi:iron(III) transport system ATP-binding protein